MVWSDAAWLVGVISVISVGSALNYRPPAPVARSAERTDKLDLCSPSPSVPLECPVDHIVTIVNLGKVHRSWDHDLNVRGIRCGEDVWAMEAALGPGKVANDGFSWSGNGVDVMLQGHKADQILGVSLNQGTRTILKVGDTARTIQSVLGSPSEKLASWNVAPDYFNVFGHGTDMTWVYRSDQSGLWVRVDPEGRLLSVLLY